MYNSCIKDDNHALVSQPRNIILHLVHILEHSCYIDRWASKLLMGLSSLRRLKITSYWDHDCIKEKLPLQHNLKETSNDDDDSLLFFKFTSILCVL